MTRSIEKLNSIFNQTVYLSDHKLFFPLLHEFALHLTNPGLQEKIQKILAGEEKMKRWVNKLPHKASFELKKLYLQQYQGISAWYALNQIIVFFERYDFGYHDDILQKLSKNNVDSSQLKYEHSELMRYVISGICPKIFPTIEEYKQYMRRVIEALKDIPSDDSYTISSHKFKFDRPSCALLIDNYKPIHFTRNNNPAVLMGYLEEAKWKPVSWDDVSEDLDLTQDSIKRTIRQINDRIPNALPPLLCAPNHPDELGKKIIALSASYTLNKFSPRQPKAARTLQ